MDGSWKWCNWRNKRKRKLGNEANLERRLSVVLVDDPESANVGADGANLGRHVDDQFVFVDQSMVTASFGRQIQVGH